MPLTEKSVELNLTSEILNHLARRYGRSFYALGPSMRAEDRLGFDVSVRAPGQALLIQYKRAYELSSGHLEWRLNRTSKQDQHEKLQLLEARGLRVFYAFPRFTTAQQLSAHRYRLLLQTFWRRPLSLQPSAGPRGHHEVRWHPVSGTWVLLSDDPVPVREPPTEWFDVFNAYFDRGDGSSYEDLARAANEVFFDDRLDVKNTVHRLGDGADDSMEGLSIIASAD